MEVPNKAIELAKKLPDEHSTEVRELRARCFHSYHIEREYRFEEPDAPGRFYYRPERDVEDTIDILRGTLVWTIVGKRADGSPCAIGEKNTLSEAEFIRDMLAGCGSSSGSEALETVSAPVPVVEEETTQLVKFTYLGSGEFNDDSYGFEWTVPFSPDSKGEKRSLTLTVWTSADTVSGFVTLSMAVGDRSGRHILQGSVESRPIIDQILDGVAEVKTISRFEPVQLQANAGQNK